MKKGPVFLLSVYMHLYLSIFLLTVYITYVQYEAIQVWCDHNKVYECAMMLLLVSHHNFQAH